MRKRDFLFSASGRVGLFAFVFLLWVLPLGATNPGDLFKSNSGRMYLAERILGEGFFSTVWQVQDLQTGERFAAKFFVKAKLQLSVLNTYEHVHRWQVSGRLRSLLKVYSPERFYSSDGEEHPIVRSELAVTNVERSEAEYFSLAGARSDEDLANRMNRAMALLHRVIGGVREMKELALNHHDLNPRNLLWTEDSFKIGDLDSIQEHGVAPKSFAWELYSAPLEYGARGFNYSDDNLSDLHQFANTLYKLLFGKYRLQEILEANSEFKSISELRAHLRSISRAQVDSNTSNRLLGLRDRFFNFNEINGTPLMAAVDTVFLFLEAALKLDPNARGEALMNLRFMEGFEFHPAPIPRRQSNSPNSLAWGCATALSIGFVGFLAFQAFARPKVAY